jgi:hypothetical protein
VGRYVGVRGIGGKEDEARGQGWIIRRGAHIYKGLAGGHITVDGYGGESTASWSCSG